MTIAEIRERSENDYADVPFTRLFRQASNDVAELFDEVDRLQAKILQAGCTDANLYLALSPMDEVEQLQADNYRLQAIVNKPPKRDYWEDRCNELKKLLDKVADEATQARYPTP